MTPPQELSASVAASRIIVRIFATDSKDSFASRRSLSQMPVLPQGQSERLLKMMKQGNRDALPSFCFASLFDFRPLALGGVPLPSFQVGPHDFNHVIRGFL